MGTNAVFTIEGGGPRRGTVYVYDHLDCVPATVAHKLLAAGLSSDSGDLRPFTEKLLVGEDREKVDHWRRTCMTNFRYEIRTVDGEVRVTGFSPDASVDCSRQVKNGHNFPKWRQIFSGTVPEFLAWSRDKRSI